MNVCDYIKNYAKAHNIENYTTKCKYLTKQDIAKSVKLANGIAFFYKIIAEGEIVNISDLTKKFLQVSTITDYWDLSPVVEVVDFGTLQKVESNFIFTCENTIDFNLFENTAESMFSNIYNFCALYMYVTPINKHDNNNLNNTDDNIKVKVKI